MTNIQDIDLFCQSTFCNANLLQKKTKLLYFFILYVFSEKAKDEMKKEYRLMFSLRMWNKFAPSNTKRRTNTTIFITTIRYKRSKKY